MFSTLLRGYFEIRTTLQRRTSYKEGEQIALQYFIQISVGKKRWLFLGWRFSPYVCVRAYVCMTWVVFVFVARARACVCVCVCVCVLWERAVGCAAQIFGTPGGCFKLHFRMKWRLSFRTVKNMERNLSLGILINGILTKKECRLLKLSVLCKAYVSPGGT